jgi:4-carboxymuconolactone decarboxylase
MNPSMKGAAVALAVTLCATAALAQVAPQAPPGAQLQASGARPSTPRPSGPLQQKLAPGLAGYTDDVLFGEIWPGAGLSPRDRSLAVISALIAMNRPAQLQGHLRRALNNGVTPLEASGALTHLAFYAGWPNAVSALEVFDTVYTERNVDFGSLHSSVPVARTQPDAVGIQVASPQIGTVAPKFLELSNRVIANDLWRRSDLSMRDRSLVTIAALTAMGDTELLDPYLLRGIEAGLTRDQIAEALTHLAFYAGWGKANKALAVVTRVIPSPQGKRD